MIPITGDLDYWRPLADRAAVSVERQTVLPEKYVLSEGKTLQEARNSGAKEVDTARLIFLDADDELDSGYIEAMTLAASQPMCSSMIFRPSTLGVYPDGSTDDYPVMLERTDLRQRNCIVIGAMCHSGVFWDIGGFSDDPVLEDWDLWIRYVRTGATIEDVPNAIYRVHVNPDSRNQDTLLHNKVYREIQKRYRP